MDGLDLSLSLSKKTYKEELAFYKAKLAGLHQKAVQKKISTTLVFEGPDAGGKGGAIRQITNALDARYYKVYPFAAPTDIENAHHYLWRFWNCVPRAGRMTIFDRSWYGRVLVERIEQFAGDDEWRRAYAEINDFEDQLLEHGIVLLKFWMHIDKDEQLRRFKAREETPHKRWKLCDEDWRNRERWDDYALAAHDMIQQTSVQNSPWILVENQNKPYGRIKVLKSVCSALENAVGD
jgi:polyphosphate kinase 2 (PPK2 family)